MDILQVFSRLLDYPTQELYDHISEVKEAIRVTPYLPPDLRRKIISELSTAFSEDIYEMQTRYDELFDRGRHHSLLLFEHIYGESRDRGQAMVDLLSVYTDAGFEIAAVHLPDYLPLFLEFLSTQDDEFAVAWLGDISHILLLLAERLRKSAAWEAVLFESMLLICGAPLEDEQVKAKVASEASDRTLKAIDREWEDKEIRFDEPVADETACGGCPSTTSTFPEPSPAAASSETSQDKWLNISDHDVHWVDNQPVR